MAYYDLFVLCVLLLVPLSELVGLKQDALATGTRRLELVSKPAETGPVSFP